MYLILSYVISAVAAVLLIVSVIFIVITACKKQNKIKRKRNIIIWFIVSLLTIVLWSVSAVILGQLIQHKTSDCIVSFNTDGGNLIADQIIEKGQTVSIPEHPEKDGFVFVGWYTDKEFNEMFNFYEPIDRSCTIFARWVNITDTTDTDGDGLPDEIEKYFGTDISSDDSDGDGLNDYIETAVLGYDPLNADTDNNGVPDADEDADRDGIDNKSEIELGTNPASADTDADGISDYYELYSYGTDPTEADTDGDGADDGWEVEHLFDPSTYNESFSVEIKSSGAIEDNDVIASALINENGKQASSLRIETIGENEHHLLTSFIPGYLGSAYDVKIDGGITSATIIFKYDTSLGTVSDVFQPRIYYLNEEEGTLEELENQTVADGEVSVNVSHFSKYILLNKVEYDSAWNTDIRPSDADLTIDSNNDGIPDYYNDLILSGDIVVSNGSREFYGINFNYDAYGNKSDDYDGDGLKNGEELEIVKNGNKVYLVIKTNPVLKDTDGDGDMDQDDSNPLKWDISDRDLAMCSSMAYSAIPSEIHSVTYLDDLPNSLKSEIDDNFNEFGEVADLAELVRWKVIDSKTELNGMQAVAFKIDSNIVVAYRGTQGLLDGLNDIAEGVAGLNVQSEPAKYFLVQVMKNNPDCNIYVTGHSLGGNLTYHAAAAGIEYNASDVKGIVTFNGLGLVVRPISFLEYLWANDILTANSSIIRDYRVYGDWVSEGVIGNITEHYGGKPIYKNKSSNVPDDIKLQEVPELFLGTLGKAVTTIDWNCHKLYTFLEDLGPKDRPIDLSVAETISTPVRSGAVLDVMDVNNQKYDNYHLTITTVPQIRDLLGNISDLKPNVVVDTDINNADGYVLDLDEGAYIISVKDNNGNGRAYTKKIKIINPSIRDEYYGLKNVVIYTNFGKYNNNTKELMMIDYLGITFSDIIDLCGEDYTIVESGGWIPSGGDKDRIIYYENSIIPFHLLISVDEYDAPLQPKDQDTVTDVRVHIDSKSENKYFVNGTIETDITYGELMEKTEGVHWQDALEFIYIYSFIDNNVFISFYYDGLPSDNSLASYIIVTNYKSEYIVDLGDDWCGENNYINTNAEQLRKNIIGLWGDGSVLNTYEFEEDGTCYWLSQEDPGKFRILDDKTLIITFPWSENRYIWSTETFEEFHKHSDEEFWYFTEDNILMLNGEKYYKDGKIIIDTNTEGDLLSILEGTWISENKFNEYKFYSDGTYEENTVVLSGSTWLLLRENLEKGKIDIVDNFTAKLWPDMPEGIGYIPHSMELKYDPEKDIIYIGGSNNSFSRAEYKE